MNTFSTRTRRRAAILFSGVLVLGGVALAGEATAGEEVAGNPTCASLGYTYGEKWDNEPSAGTYTVNRDGMEASLRVGTHADKTSPNPNNAILEYSISTAADGYAIVVKGGNGATVYRSGSLVTPMHAPAVSSDKWPTISHFQLCWNGPATQPEVGQLEVTKIVVGTEHPADHTFEICVTPVAGGEPRCQTVVGNGTLTFGTLPTGEYVVTETDPGPRFSVEGSGATVTVELDDTTRATVTNTWIPPSEAFGRVEVTKVVTGEGAPIDDVYEICLEGPNPSTTNECKTVTGEGTVTFEDLVPGIYKVTETTSGTGYTATITPATVEVTIGGVATATVTNVYTEQESLPPTPEVLPPTVPVPPEVLPPTVPVTPAGPATPSNVAAAQTALPTTGSESGIAVIATILVAAGIVLTLVGRRRAPQQA